MKVIRIGVVGCGVIGSIHAKIISGQKGAELAAVADINPSLTGEMHRAYGCRQYSDYREMLKNGDIDAVAVCVPPAMHYQAVLDAAGAGKHVLVEKPMEISLDHAGLMIEVCRRQGVKLGVVFQHRFDRVIRVLKGVTSGGRLGKLLMGTSRTIWYRDSGYYSVSWRGTYANGGGALMNQSIHSIDLLQYIMGGVDSVSAVCGTLLHKSIEVEDTGIAVLRFKNGAVGTVEGTTIAYPGLYSELNIYGEEGTISIKNDRLDFYRVKTGTIPELDELLETAAIAETAVSAAANLDLEAHGRQYEDFLSAVREDREPLINGKEGCKALEIINAIYRSSAEGKWIQLGDSAG